MRSWRAWLPGCVLVVGLCAANSRTSDVARHLGWWRNHGEVVSLIEDGFGLAALSVGVLTVCQVAWSPMECQTLKRVLSSCFFVGIGFQVGGRYVHLCAAGFKAIELSACFGLPILVGAIVFFSRRQVLAYVVVCTLMTIAWLFAQPYLDWVHGN